MRPGLISLIFILVAPILFVILALTTTRIYTQTITNTKPTPKIDSIRALNTIIEQQNKEEPNLEQDSGQKLLGVKTGTNYTALVYDLSASTVVTDTAIDGDCTNNCATKPLAQYVRELGGRGGMNGTYFCPPDYTSCSGKTNSFDFPVWNNRHKKWINSDKLFWGGRGMMVFRPGSAQFFANSANVGAPSDISGGIINYPSLLSGGNIIFSEGSLPANLKTKAARSGIGFGGGKLYLVIARKSSMTDLANIFKSLGASDALNLDGGGSVALYEAKYRAGPGRSLPNAVIVK